MYMYMDYISLWVNIVQKRVLSAIMEAFPWIHPMVDIEARMLSDNFISRVEIRFKSGKIKQSLNVDFQIHNGEFGIFIGPTWGDSMPNDSSKDDIFYLLGAAVKELKKQAWTYNKDFFGLQTGPSQHVYLYDGRLVTPANKHIVISPSYYSIYAPWPDGYHWMHLKPGTSIVGNQTGKYFSLAQILDSPYDLKKGGPEL